MDLQGTNMHNGPGWAWARTGALVLFLLTGILLLASLSTARSQETAFPPGVAHEVQST
jgi:hypothetical protein